jgi:hypothetical protein
LLADLRFRVGKLSVLACPSDQQGSASSGAKNLAFLKRRAMAEGFRFSSKEG